MTLNGKVNGRKIKPAVTAIIQARMHSKRLPGKAMLKGYLDGLRARGVKLVRDWDK